MSDSLIAFIGGTGFDLRGPDSPFQNPVDERVDTRFGPAHITRASLDGKGVVFLHRHAQPDDPNQKTVPPHKINYRANIAALKKLGVTGILASTAVGGLRPDWKPGSLVCLDQFLDMTTNRVKTFFDTRAIHTDVTHPYCSHLRELLLKAAYKLVIRAIRVGQVPPGAIRPGWTDRGFRAEPATQIRLNPVVAHSIKSNLGICPER